MGVGGQRHAPAALPPLPPRERDPVPIVQDAVWALGQIWTGVENLASPPGFDPRTVQLVASRYTDWAIAALNNVLYVKKIFKTIGYCK
jgi:hypothetical protein